MRRPRYRYHCPKCDRTAHWNGIGMPSCQLCGSVTCTKCSKHPMTVCNDCFPHLPLVTQKKLKRMKSLYWGFLGLFLIPLLIFMVAIQFFEVDGAPVSIPEFNFFTNYKFNDVRFWLRNACVGLACLPFLGVFWWRYTHYEINPDLVEKIRNQPIDK